ncbi:hypothetical protein CO180_00060 [candidate division WWE3 bacterium CG_4_9_14_3_um_filter_41_6]|uniref:Uncharacterized protein n=1 Tax=candidate division WWE3 bacterium CG_4_10_14_0_2_um_filter_41_14 TaxID=1975072 RepID=A0A2M7TI81_UNCKA|nr:MAG: hypothetical protein COY32_04210 [candidate division WWE3 bacterium CG_4_10_14_0_2_um_filter_41_14]PJA39740.1 MAG: hypothetical protein CO180_00060 [candidate division WWE3 bacterium CG_4_9_14_3_um_filter_41_6]
MNQPFVRLWVFGLVWVVLPMLSLNAVDILVVRGMNSRPQGYFAYWMIPIFDIVFFPLFFAVSVKLARSFQLSSFQNYAAIGIGSIVAIAYVLWFWNMEIAQVAADPSMANWTVDVSGHNYRAYVHAVIMLTVVAYTVAFFIRYGMWASVVALPMVWGGFAISVIVFMAVTWVASSPPWAMSPNEVLSHLLGFSVNF